jgi:2'-5' RNA ligase
MSARPPRLRMYLKQPRFSYLHVHHGAGSRGGPGSRGGHGHLHILSRGPRAGRSVFIYGDEEPSARAPGTPDARQAPATENTGVMVAYYPPMETARRLAIPGYETAGDLHMTVLYLGKAGAFPFEKREKLRAAVAAFAAGEQPIGARISELRRFPPSESSDGKDVWYAAVHSEHLHDLRARLKAALAEAGITVEDTHPHYTPHITLAYCAPGEEQPVSRISRQAAAPAARAAAAALAARGGRAMCASSPAARARGRWPSCTATTQRGTRPRRQSHRCQTIGAPPAGNPWSISTWPA